MSEPRLQSRDSDEFMGIARRLAEQQVLSVSDACFLESWVQENQRVWDQPVFWRVLHFVFNHSWGTPPTQATLDKLHRLLRDLSGDANDDGKPDGPTTIAFTDPVPQICFDNRRFCFTGTFKYGTRDDCEAAVLQLGANVSDISGLTHYLIVGSKITESWKHSTFGRKISKAVELKIPIVREDDWIAQLSAYMSKPLGPNGPSGLKSSTSHYLPPAPSGPSSANLPNGNAFNGLQVKPSSTTSLYVRDNIGSQVNRQLQEYQVGQVKAKSLGNDQIGKQHWPQIQLMVFLLVIISAAIIGWSMAP